MDDVPHCSCGTPKRWSSWTLQNKMSKTTYAGVSDYLIILTHVGELRMLVGENPFFVVWILILDRLTDTEEETNNFVLLFQSSSANFFPIYFISSYKSTNQSSWVTRLHQGIPRELRKELLEATGWRLALQLWELLLSGWSSWRGTGKLKHLERTGSHWGYNEYMENLPLHVYIYIYIYI